MKIVITPDSFKGSLTAKEVTTAMCKATKKVYPQAEIVGIPFSDGGEGAIEVLEQAGLGKRQLCKTKDPLNRPIAAPYFLFSNHKTAWVELSESSGLLLLKEKERNPLLTSTFGTGLLIKDALQKGCKHIIVGVGGSATHDLGTGIFSALGGKLLDAYGKEIPWGGGFLEKCKYIESNALKENFNPFKITVACDVTNPLLGKDGAAFTYARQKGASAEAIAMLERNSIYFSKRLNAYCKKDIAKISGSGAAGGTAAGLMALLGATLESGFLLLSKITGLENHIKSADLVITGEGSYDAQSNFGKLTTRIREMAHIHHVPSLILAGQVIPKKNAQSDSAAAFQVTPKGMSIEQAFEHAENLIYEKLCEILEGVKRKEISLPP